MRLFVASSYLNRKVAQDVQRLLVTVGHSITFDWTQPEDLSVPGASTEKALADARGVVLAEAVVVVWPGRLGTATEIGIAIGCGIPIYILGKPNRPSIYWNHPLVTIVNSRAELLYYLGERHEN